MMRKDRADRLHSLRSKRCHQLADGRAECFHHLAARNGEANDRRFLDVGLA